jgi:hypothetical protein
MSLGLIQPVREMSTKDLPWCGGGSGGGGG